MTNSKIISGDTHIVEPPDRYESRMPEKMPDRTPCVRRQKTPEGKESDAWFLGGMQVITLGTVTQAGQRFEDPEKIDFIGIWEEVRKGAYTSEAMVKRIGVRRHLGSHRATQPGASLVSPRRQ